MRKFLGRAGTLALLWALLVIALTLSPSDLLPETPVWADLLSWDKLAHAFLFGIQTWLIARTMHKSMRIKASSLLIALIAFLGGTIFGTLIELAQYALPLGRNGNMLDLLADIAGSLVASGLFLRMARINT